MTETEFKKGDIICNKGNQNFLRVVVHVEENTIWCMGLVLMGLRRNKTHPSAFPICLDDPDEEILCLGNLEDFTRLVDEYEMEQFGEETGT